MATECKPDEREELVADAGIKAAYVQAFGSDAGWLDSQGSYFIEDYRAGSATPLQERHGHVQNHE